MTSNRKLVGIGVTALSLALAVATPAFAVGLGGGAAMHVGSGPSRLHPRHVVSKPRFRGDQAIVGAAVSSADASYCAQRWAYYDPASGKYLGDDGEWHPCPG
jgi:BA14K-like protein